MNDFRHRHAAHCESGVVASLLSHYGLSLSEPMVFGLSGALAFAHLPFPKVNGFPVTSYRMPPGTIVRRIRKVLKIPMHRRRFRDAAEGMRALDAELDAGRPVGLQTSVYWLPYFPPEMRFHFNAHNLIAFERNSEGYGISDPVFEHTVACAAPDLEKARFVKGVFAPKGFMYRPDGRLDERELATAIRRSIRRTARQMLYPPLPWIGVRGISHLARRLPRIAAGKDPRYALLYLGMVIRMQEEIGTGGGGFRYMYASFLEEARDHVASDALSEGADLAGKAGDGWREFALRGARMIKDRDAGKASFDALAERLHECRRLESDLFRVLIKA